jgi:D-sedoheptulose 7-phosphate isomerase
VRIQKLDLHWVKMNNFPKDADIQDVLNRSTSEHLSLVSSIAEFTPNISKITLTIVRAFSRGNKLLIFGNGGSAADAQHIAAELVGRFITERDALPAIALTTDSSILTSVGNDYGYEHVFSRQVEAIAKPGDVVVGISTSGNSANVLKALVAAQQLNCHTVGLLGKDGGKIKEIADASIIIPSSNTARIQEMHILIGHLLCEAIDYAISLK